MLMRPAFVYLPRKGMLLMVRNSEWRAKCPHACIFEVKLAYTSYLSCLSTLMNKVLSSFFYTTRILETGY